MATAFLRKSPPTTERDRRGIAILATDAFLRTITHDDLDALLLFAAHLERGIFEELKEERLASEAIPDETRLPRSKQVVNPLRLASEPHNALPPSPHP